MLTPLQAIPTQCWTYTAMMSIRRQPSRTRTLIVVYDEPKKATVPNQDMVVYDEPTLMKNKYTV